MEVEVELSVQFWRAKEAIYPRLVPETLDLLSCPCFPSICRIRAVFYVRGQLLLGGRTELPHH